MANRFAWTCLGVLLALGAAGGGVAYAADVAPTPRELAAQAEAQLDQGRVEEAARLSLEAARMAPGDATLADRAMVLRRIASLRRFVAEQPASDRWLTGVVTLHAFYLGEDLPWLALELDRQAHARQGSGTTAIMLAETHLVLRQNAEAVEMLSARSVRTPHEDVLLGIGLARLGRSEEAGAIADTIALPEDALPVMRQDVARLEMLLGRWPQAFATLRTSLEKTPPAAIAAARARILKCEDFGPAREDPTFQAVLSTESAVAQTCSGGTSCASCPNRGGCGKR